MTLYPVSFLLALLFMLPQWAQWQDVQFPLQGLLGIPATGLSYMAVFFHEIGHCLTGWLFGYAGFPVFDFNHGGGLLLHGAQNKFLLALVYGGFSLGAFVLFKKEMWGSLGALAVAAALHAFLAFTEGHGSLMNYMGQGAEVGVGCFLLLRGLTGHDAYGAAEKWLNMVVAQFFLMNAAFLDYTLLTDEVARIVYEQQKGTHGFGDFSRIAGAFGLSLAQAAGVALAIIIVMTLATIACGLYARRKS